MTSANGIDGAVSFASSPNDTITVVARQDKPYCPGNVQINGESWPTSVNRDLTFNWSNRDRDNINQPISWFDAADNLEPGATVTLILKKASSQVVIHTEVGLTGTSFSYSLADELVENGGVVSDLILEMHTERSGVISLNTVVMTFDRFTPAEWNLTATPTIGWDLTDILV